MGVKRTKWTKILISVLMKVTTRTCKSLIAKVVKQEERYWIEDINLYEEIDENSEACS